MGVDVVRALRAAPLPKPLRCHVRPGRSTAGTETVPVLRPGEIRMIPRNQVAIVHRTLGAFRARTRDVSDRYDWLITRDDIAVVRAGGQRGIFGAC